MIKCSLLISTYNWPEALSLCLQSVLLQTRFPNEIIICDDGSSEKTKSVIDDFRSRFDIPLIHIWQPDEGFQLARIRNKGFAASTCEYCIQIDGDLVLHPRFVENHIAFAKRGYFATGSRVLLSPSTSQSLIDSNNSQFPVYKFSRKNRLNGIHVPFLRFLFAFFYKKSGRSKFYVKGCNMAFWRSDIININGYNETFTGWGREDSELAIRLINSGVKKRFLKFGAICYHLYHKEASREMEPVNTQIMLDAIKNKSIMTPIGINQYIS